jgi:3,4-dihydroxy 2-butanone 4-phosphate synthase / GTP cyclohydrolase II
MTTLQVQLDRQIFRLDREPTDNSIKPSSICDRLETQRVYVFSSHAPND